MAAFQVPESTAEYLFKQATVGNLGGLLQRPEVAMALMGGGLGAGIGALSGDEKNRWRNGLIGAGLGGTGGYLFGRYGIDTPGAATSKVQMPAEKPTGMPAEKPGSDPSKWRNPD
jgi:hypothetical protein